MSNKSMNVRAKQRPSYQRHPLLFRVNSTVGPMRQLVAALLCIGILAFLSERIGAKEEPMKKTFAPFPGGQLRELAPGRGACFATDMITVEGKKVRFMYRAKPDNSSDSGWRFMAGFESDAYMDDPSHHGIYDINTIANYDPDIVPFMDAPVGSAFERPDGNTFVSVDFAPPE